MIQMWMRDKMAIQHALEMLKSKAINDISKVLKGPVSYCWQEETREEVIISSIENIISALNINIEKTKKKYKNKLPQKV